MWVCSPTAPVPDLFLLADLRSNLYTAPDTAWRFTVTVRKDERLAKVSVDIHFLKHEFVSRVRHVEPAESRTIRAIRVIRVHFREGPAGGSRWTRLSEPHLPRKHCHVDRVVNKEITMRPSSKQLLAGIKWSFTTYAVPDISSRLGMSAARSIETLLDHLLELVVEEISSLGYEVRRGEHDLAGTSLFWP